ncbi:hypothetical protein KIW84_061650 [Lathyrus oleraceus]|uniref:Uncharacterized protein n=1 Tax=Pisum sativum TaxID=3888 RepID=A0A9D4W3N2_PEA|nr:hypothetical protein KIW84_061650 [Pisum sativum]
MLTLWQELDLCYDDNWRCKEDNVLFLSRQENDRVFMFLVGLYKDLDEARQGIMMRKTPRRSESEGSTVATRKLNEGKRSYKVPWCDHCKREWNTRETCWKLKGKLPNWKKKGGRAFQDRNS